MKLYLSSYKIGNQEEKLMKIAENSNGKAAYINNALDFATDLERKNTSDAKDVTELKKIGLTVDILSLENYFHEPDTLAEQLDQYDVLWVRGGNVFVLARAMQLSGFDEIIKKYYQHNKNILYGGYSAGVCVLGPTLRGLHLVDDPNINPYKGNSHTIWDGLGILDYAVVPHYKSSHGESDDIDSVVEFMAENNIPYKTLRDGEVIIIE